MGGTGMGVKHTPGPWEIEEDEKLRLLRIATPDWIVAEIRLLGSREHDPIDRTNAKILVASLDLYRACKDCLENRGDWMAAMSAAISRAEAEFRFEKYGAQQGKSTT